MIEKPGPDNKMKRYLLPILLLIAMVSGCGREDAAQGAANAKPAIYVQLADNEYAADLPELDVYSDKDVLIKDVQVNKGDCRVIHGRYPHPYKLVAGNSMRVDVGAPCKKITEVTIITDRGDFVFPVDAKVR